MRYMDDRIVFDSQWHVVATELFEDFSQWLDESGHVAWSDQNFSARLGQHSVAKTNGVEKKRGIRSSRPGLSRRHGPGLSRRHGGTTWATGVAVPKSYTAWLGVRFRTPDD
jgi:putative DNA primase/helicase